jgi:uncharacterized protein involved in outer membrane biogenesis
LETSKEIQIQNKIENPLIGERQNVSKIKKIFSLLTIPLIVIILAIYIVPSFIDWQGYRAELIKNIKNITGRDVLIDGEISFSSIPTPSFSIEGLNIKNTEGASVEYMINIDNIKAYPSLFSLLFGKVDIQNIELGNAVVNLESFDGELPNWSFNKEEELSEDNEVRNIISQYFNVNLINVESIRLLFLSGNRDNPVERVMPLQNIKIEAESLSGPFAINGKLKSNINDIEAGFNIKTGKFSAGDPAEVVFNLYSGGSNFDISGEIKDWAAYPIISGKLKSEIDQSVQSLSDYFGIDESILPTKVSAIFSNNKTKIDGDFFISSKGVDIKNILINSISTKGEGAVGVIFDKVTKVDVSLSFEYIDLDDLFKESKASNDVEASFQKRKELREVEEFLSREAKKHKETFNLNKNLNLILNISAAKVKYNEYEFNQFNIQADITNGEVIVHSFSANNLPGNASVNIIGDLEGDQVSRLSSKRFYSEVKASGESLYELLKWSGIATKGINIDKLGSFDISASAEFSPESTSITKVIVKIGDLNAVGQLLIKYGIEEGEKPTINSAFKVNKLNLDKYIRVENIPAGEDVEEYQEIQDEAFFDRLRNLDLYFKTTGIKILVNDLTYNQKNFKAVSAVVVIKPGILNLKQFKVKSGDLGNIEGTAIVNAKDLRPTANINIMVDHLSLGDAPKYNSSVPEFSDEALSFKRLGVADTDFSLKFKALSLGRLHIKKAHLSGTINEDAIDFKKFRGILEGGKLDVKAVMGVRRPSASASFSLASADITRLSKSWFGLKNITAGKMSMSGTVSTSGSSLKSWFNNIEGAGNITARGGKLSGFNWLALTNKVDSIKSADNLTIFANKALSSGKTTIDYIAGNIYITNGVADFRNLVFTQPLINYGALNAQLNIPKWELNLDAAINLKLRNAGGVFVSAIPLTVNISGPLNNLKTKWDSSGVKAYWENKFYKAR